MKSPITEPSKNQLEELSDLVARDPESQSLIDDLKINKKYMRKRVIFLMLMAFVSLGISANDKNKLIVKKDNQSITFLVDKNLPAPKQKMQMVKGNESPLWDKNTLAASFKYPGLVGFRQD